jgi:DHA2 family multidrug resistance protein
MDAESSIQPVSPGKVDVNVSAGTNAFAKGGLLVAGILLSVLTEAIAGTVLTLGRVDMIGDLHATPDEFSALDISYTAAKLVGFLVAGWLVGHVPAHRLVVIATLAMGGACALAALATRLDLLVALRAMQGMSGGLLLVGGQVLLFVCFPRQRQPLLQALFAMAAVVVPSTVALALEGWLVDALSWTWIFFLAVPLSLAGAGFLVLTDVSDSAMAKPRPVDRPALVLLVVLFASVVYVLTLGSRWNWLEAPRIGWLALVSVVLLLIFLGRQAIIGRGTLIEFSAFRSADFAFAFVVSFVAGAALFGSAYLIPTFALSQLAFPATDTGLLLLPSSGMFAASLFLSACLIQFRALNPFATVPIGILLIMFAMWLLTGSTAQSGFADLLPAILLRGLGLGFLFLSITLIAFQNLPLSALSTGIGLFNTGRQLGGMMGVAGLQTLIDGKNAQNATTLASHINAGTPAVMQRLETMEAQLMLEGLDAVTAARIAVSGLARTAGAQASVLSFEAAFLAVALLFVCAAPVLIAVRLGLIRLHASKL